MTGDLERWAVAQCRKQSAEPAASFSQSTYANSFAASRAWAYCSQRVRFAWRGRDSVRAGGLRLCRFPAIRRIRLARYPHEKAQAQSISRSVGARPYSHRYA